jgi:hypothetical protein
MPPSDQRNRPAAVAFKASGNFELQQNHTHDPWRSFGQPYQIVDRDRRDPGTPFSCLLTTPPANLPSQ